MYIGKIILPKQWWSWLVITTQKQDLGAIIASSMKMSAQCSVAITKVNWMLGIIKRGIEKEKNPTKQKPTKQKNPILGNHVVQKL